MIWPGYWPLANIDEHRNGKRAVEFAELAILHSDDSWEFGDTLAAALAETDEYSEASQAVAIAMDDVPADRKRYLI